MSAGQRVVEREELAQAPSTKPRRQRWFEYQKPIPVVWSLVLGLSVWVLFFGMWELAAVRGWIDTLFMPPPHQVLSTLYTMIAERGFLSDIGISIYRILLSFAMACAIAIPLGVLMGSFRTVDAFFNPFVSAWRYLPAPAFIPLLLMWFGVGEGSKLALLFIGVIFFLITLIMDHTRAVRAELIETAMTLGANRWQILSTIVLPAVAPKILVSMRQMLAVSWTYLVIAEIVAATTSNGCPFRAAILHRSSIASVAVVMIGMYGSTACRDKDGWINRR